MSNKIIRAELETKLSNWQLDNTEVDVVLEGEPYNRGTRPFVEAFLLPAATLDVTVDAKRQRYVGIFQLSVWVKDGQGTAQIDDISNSLIAYFPIIPKTGNVSVERTPSATQPVLDPAGYRVVHITITYRYES